MPNCLISERETVDKFKGALWDDLDSRIVSQNHPQTAIDVFTKGQIHRMLQDVEKTVNWVKFKPKAEVKGNVTVGKYAFLDDRDWKMNGVMITDLCSTQRAGRVGLKVIKNENQN